MKKSVIAKLGAIGMAAACMSIAGAQTSGISVRIGGFFPTNSLASDIGGTWFAFGADMKLSTMHVSAPVTGTESYFGISADYYAHGSDSDVPVALTYNLRQGPATFSAGVGPDFRNAGDLTDTGVGIAEQLGVSYNISSLPTPVFLQIKYFFASRPELSGFGAYIGVKF